MIVESKLWHYLWLVERGLRASDNLSIRAFTRYAPDEVWAQDSYRSALFRWTLIDDGKPVCICAMYEVVPGVLHVWGVGSDGVSSTYREWFPWLKRKLAEILSAGRCHRIECYVTGGNEPAIRVAEHLGFEVEGVRRSAGRRGEDAIMYARRNK
jgi:RimJ/RimL family protein N-acetyltransferase